MPLGVGLPYLRDFDDSLYRREHVDFVEITPDTLCKSQRSGARMALDRELIEKARDVCGPMPIVVHGVELSIGSARRWNHDYVTMLGDLQAIWPFRWHSEHLHFQTFDRGDGNGEVETGVPLPLPLTGEASDLVAGRAAELARLFGVPFLLENAAHYLGALPRDCGIEDEGDFLNRIVASGDCGILLDLHNLHCNSVNNGTDAVALLDRLRLDRVVEIHVAGGSWADGFRMDAHDSIVPEPVWDLLDMTMPRCPNLAGVVFEVMAGHARRVGRDAIASELARLRAAWNRHVTAES